jgi:hypothetical protein
VLRGQPNGSPRSLVVERVSVGLYTENIKKLITFKFMMPKERKLNLLLVVST